MTQERVTKEEFIKQYCENSKFSREYFDEWLVALPCDCDFEGCRGWGAGQNPKKTKELLNGSEGA